ncbi:hypothetical protein Q9233_013215 [Columba guinea]|nr:hypothetical protein Q9233_013215 [Columba guinea]
MSQAQPYAPRKSSSPAAGARRNDSQDYLLLDAEPCEESALPPYAFYPVILKPHNMKVTGNLGLQSVSLSPVKAVGLQQPLAGQERPRCYSNMADIEKISNASPLTLTSPEIVG